jgi:signal transduction histidine kinase
MEKTAYNITGFLLIATLLVLVMAGFILVILYFYKKKQITYLKTIEAINHDHEKNLLQSRIEVQEQTLQDISREIHDNISLSLTLAKLQLNTLDIYDKNKTDQAVSSSVDLLSKSINDLSDLSKSMNAEIIAQEGLIDALKNEMARISKSGLLEIDIEINGNTIFLDAQKELVIFRIIQEALNNIIKHASARKVILDLYYHTNDLEITIKDDGKGFDPENLSTKTGAGIRNMKTRAKIFDGEVKIESNSDLGTKVLISIPF